MRISCSASISATCEQPRKPVADLNRDNKKSWLKCELSCCFNALTLTSMELGIQDLWLSSFESLLGISCLITVFGCGGGGGGVSAFFIILISAAVL